MKHFHKDDKCCRLGSRRQGYHHYSGYILYHKHSVNFECCPVSILIVMSLWGKPLRNKVDVQTEFCQIAFQRTSPPLKQTDTLCELKDDKYCMYGREDRVGTWKSAGPRPRLLKQLSGLEMNVRVEFIYLREDSIFVNNREHTLGTWKKPASWNSRAV